MARLESEAKAGFYPTPPRVTAAIARHLTPAPTGSRRVIRLLDPCAGTGLLLATIAHALGAESYGIELNTERAEMARGRLDHVLASSAFAVRLAHGAFSCIPLNPPYSSDAEHRRLEHAFLTAMTRTLVPGGGELVFIIPQRRLAVSARFLASHYTGFGAYGFPDPEFAAFGQMVLFAIRKRQPSSAPEAQARLESWSIRTLPPLPDEPAGAASYVLPALPRDDVLFASLLFDPVQAAAEAGRRGVWVHPQLVEQLWPSDERPVGPLMPLRQGHLALLIAAGMLNNVALRQGDTTVLVKGRTHKTFVQVRQDEETVVEREVIRTAVTVLDMHTGRLERVDQGPAAAALAEAA